MQQLALAWGYVSNSLGRSGLILAPGAFRLALAMIVFVSHVSRLNIGVLGVMLFFLLSGYWVTSILRGKFARQSIGLFYASRYLRIVPLYLLVAIPAAIAFEKPLLPNILLLGIASNKQADALSISWSLDIELQFYLLLPLLLATMRKVSRTAVLASILIAAFGWLLPSETGVVTVLQYLPAFAIGAYLHDNPYKPTTRAAYGSVIAFFLLTAAFAIIPGTSEFLVKGTTVPEGTPIFSMIWMLPLIPYVAYSLSIRSDKVDRHLGNLSYPFYLVHTVMLYVSALYFDGMIQKILGLIATVLLSIFLYVVVDRRLENLRYKWLAPKS